MVKAKGILKRDQGRTEAEGGALRAWPWPLIASREAVKRLALFVKQGDQIKRDEQKTEAEISRFGGRLAARRDQEVADVEIVAPVEREAENGQQAYFHSPADHIKSDDRKVHRHLPGGN